MYSIILPAPTLRDAETRFLDRESGFPVPPRPEAPVHAGGTRRCGTCNGAGRYNVRTEVKKNGKTEIVVVSQKCGACGGSGQVPA